MTHNLSRSALAAAVLAAGATAAFTTLASASASPRSAPSAPKTLTAARITRQTGTLAPGKVVGSSSLGQRVFVNAHDGFALAAVGQAQYPAETTDGGATWKTFGPALHVNAAQAPLSVTDLGAANARTVYYYGSGQAVDVTSNGGKTWWRALCSELSLAVVPGVSGRLVWITQDSPTGGAAVTWPYESSDGGRVWHYTTAFGGGD
jgi:photosystem II stability/assembly factor-like uncharacterized protein